MVFIGSSSHAFGISSVGILLFTIVCADKAFNVDGEIYIVNIFTNILFPEIKCNNWNTDIVREGLPLLVVVDSKLINM